MFFKKRSFYIRIAFYCQDILQQSLLSYLMQCIYYAFMLSLLISNIVQTSQVIDFAFVDLFHVTYAIHYYPIPPCQLVTLHIVFQCFIH